MPTSTFVHLTRAKRHKSNPPVVSATSTPLRIRVGTEDIELTSAFKGYSPAVHFLRLIQEDGLETGVLQRLMWSLPSFQAPSVLLDIFFRDINAAVLSIDEFWRCRISESQLLKTGIERSMASLG
ncbi:uncharacterized protein PFL1_01486 [Pseudozyma flocculosa PF-1]|uniref:Uncharacterized protein n=1 Tax=Pseudozyma flocculosa TaxID=84751 RepID=A0A5C3FBE9_9BASI|nr:uncharacterized protein PFL1_01486 [Pseudozyma flocculosa PF-1]EPQ31301.1 hypothetical protein PFL1_01486 [Pseudozyma flocculosa PF-1]SPO41763.1 uncharacterized protein PSFLO_07245 [Pseudozyma flocculosa]